MRERESVSLTPALSRCLSLFAHHLRYTRYASQRPKTAMAGRTVLLNHRRFQALSAIIQ